MSSRRKPFLIYMVIIALQIVVILYWANEKSNFFIDELFSKGYTSSFTGEGDTARYITESPEWKFNEWINNASFKKYLVVSDEEQIFQLPFLEAVKKILSGRNYFGLLNIAESIAGYSIVSARPGILLNISIFIILEIAFLIFMRKIKMDVRSRYLALIMFGFSGYIISCVLYIRFYIIVIMYLMWLLNLYYCVWSNSDLKKLIPAEIGILVLTYLSYKNSELTMNFFFAISFCFAIALMISKKWKQFVSYVIVGLCSCSYILATTDYVDILFHPAKYSAVKNQAAKASVRISEVSLDIVKSNVYRLMELIGYSYFGHYLVILLAAIALTTYSLWVLNRKRDELERTGVKIDRQKMRLSSESEFICVLLGTATVYTLFAIVASFNTWRYHCFDFVLMAIVFWYIWDRVLTQFVPREMICGWYVILLVSVSFSALIPFRTRNIEYIYEDDRNFKYAVEQYKDIDTVLVVCFLKSTGGVSTQETYDCINQMSGNSNVYAVNIDEYLYDEVEFTNEFILWSHKERDISCVLNDLDAHGYQIESLGQNHISQAYVCRINEKESQ